MNSGTGSTGAHADEWTSEVFDTVEVYLAFYAHFGEEDEYDVSGE
jgi:hypothetical protein